MPICKNDPKRSYIGDEPSPKGFGYCAHAEKIGTTKIGKDGNLWIIQETKTGSKRWVKKTNNKITLEKSNKNTDNKLDCSKFVNYIKKEKKSFGTLTHSIMGLEFEKGFIYKAIDFNKFEKEPTKIPEGYRKTKVDAKYIKKYWCDSSKKLLTKNITKINHPNSKSYLIHDNGGRPFLVYISKNEVNIYTYPDKKYYISNEDKTKKWTYIDKIATYKNPIKIFIGKSPRTKMTEFSGGIGKKFDGNSILIQLEKNRYVSIGAIIYEFIINDDQINEYISPVGNNDVPYPVAISDKNVYFILDMKYVPIDKFDKFNQEVKDNAYMYYYGYEGNEPLSKYAKKYKSKIIKKSLY